MKKFEEVALELITFVKDDVITTSGTFSSEQQYDGAFCSMEDLSNNGLNFN